MTETELIDSKIAGLADWRGEMLGRIRKLIKDADPEVVEEVKWRKPSNPSGVPTWSHAEMICTGETYKDKVKLTFAGGPLRPVQLEPWRRHSPSDRFQRGRHNR
jgi:hypothetical protein